MMAHHLDRCSNSKEWSVTIIDEMESHYYQPRFLFYPFAKYEAKDIRRDICQLIPKGVHYKNSVIDCIDPSDKTVTLGDKTKLTYDILIIATGTRIAPEEVEGMMEKWHEVVFDFYTFEGASALRKKLISWQGGKLVVHICETPIKCPVAPLEFAFLADDFFIRKGMCSKVDITYVTPMSGAFSKPIAAKKLEHLLEQKGINVVSDFYIERVDNQQ